MRSLLPSTRSFARKHIRQLGEALLAWKLGVLGVAVLNQLLAFRCHHEGLPATLANVRARILRLLRQALLARRRLHPGSILPLLLLLLELNLLLVHRRGHRLLSQ